MNNPWEKVPKERKKKHSKVKDSKHPSEYPCINVIRGIEVCH